MNQFFSSGKEFSLIEALFDPNHFSKTAEGLGDDAFLFQSGGENWAVSTDTSVEGIHYREDWGGVLAGLEKALLANLSDINAMGGETVFAFFNLGALKSWDKNHILKISALLKRLEQTHGFRIVGGDTVSKETESFFTFTVIGRVKGKPLLRSNGRPGQRIYCSGPLGTSAAGLNLYSKGLKPNKEQNWEPFFEGHLRPRPPLKLGPLLGQHLTLVSAIDISDGLSSELHHLSKQSGCKLVVDWSKLLYTDNHRASPDEFPLRLQQLPGGGDWKNWMLHGGEDYELLFTGNFLDTELAELRKLADVPMLKEIGYVEMGTGVVIVDEFGKEKELMAHGWSH